jgi:hypothetical protein
MAGGHIYISDKHLVHRRELLASEVEVAEEWSEDNSRPFASVDR